MERKGSKEDPEHVIPIRKESKRAGRRKALYGAAYVYGLLFAFCGVLMDLGGHNDIVAILTLICLSIGICGSWMFAFMQGKDPKSQ